jgi:hypothetical protein
MVVARNNDNCKRRIKDKRPNLFKKGRTMNETKMTTTAGANFAVAQIGTFDNLNNYKFTHQKLPFEVEGNEKLWGQA